MANCHFITSIFTKNCSCFLSHNCTNFRSFYAKSEHWLFHDEMHNYGIRFTVTHRCELYSHALYHQSLKLYVGNKNAIRVISVKCQIILADCKFNDKIGL